MKRLFPLALAGLLLAGCQLNVDANNNDTTNTQVEDTTYWVSYYPTQCNVSPWGDTLDETTIINYYQTNLGVAVDAIEVTPPAVGYISCAACGCGTGTQVSLQTDTSGRRILLEHGYTEETNTEDWSVDDSMDTTNVNPTIDNGDTVNTNLNIAEDTNVNVDPGVSETELVDPNEPVLSEVDAELQTRAEQWQVALDGYYASHGSYPDTLIDLNMTIDDAGITYTPIGITPADYYDLSVEYSTGRVVLNP